LFVAVTVTWTGSPNLYGVVEAVTKIEKPGSVGCLSEAAVGELCPQQDTATSGVAKVITIEFAVGVIRIVHR